MYACKQGGIIQYPQKNSLLTNKRIVYIGQCFYDCRWLSPVDLIEMSLK